MEPKKPMEDRVFEAGMRGLQKIIKLNPIANIVVGSVLMAGGMSLAFQNHNYSQALDYKSSIEHTRVQEIDNGLSHPVPYSFISTQSNQKEDIDDLIQERDSLMELPEYSQAEEEYSQAEEAHEKDMVKTQRRDIMKTLGGCLLMISGGFPFGLGMTRIVYGRNKKRKEEELEAEDIQ